MTRVWTDRSLELTASAFGTMAAQDANNVAVTGGSISGVTDIAVADGGSGASTAREACKNLGAVYILAQSYVSASGPADLNENTLATVTVPAGAMGANGSFRVTASWSVTNNANAKNLRFRFSGAGGTAIMDVNAASVTDSWQQAEVGNVNAANSQRYMSRTEAAINAHGTSAEDTSASKTLVITCQKANAADTITLTGYKVELLYGV